MTYRVVVVPSASRAIDDLPKDVRRRIFKHLVTLAQNPRPHGSIKMEGDLGYRIRVGDYRIIYDIDDDVVTVTVTRVGHRRDVYR